MKPAELQFMLGLVDLDDLCHLRHADGRGQRQKHQRRKRRAGGVNQALHVG